MYYLRVLRLFFNVGPARENTAISPLSNLQNNALVTKLISYDNVRVIPVTSVTNVAGFVDRNSRVYLTSFCVVALFIVPLFVIKPFVL